MNTKSFATLAIAGLLATASVYTLPAFAADDLTGAQTALSSSSDEAEAALTADTGQSSGADQQNAASPADSANSGTNNVGSTNDSDEGSPDTATGDDDY